MSLAASGGAGGTPSKNLTPEQVKGALQWFFLKPFDTFSPDELEAITSHLSKQIIEEADTTLFAQKIVSGLLQEHGVLSQKELLKLKEVGKISTGQFAELKDISNQIAQYFMTHKDSLLQRNAKLALTTICDCLHTDQDLKTRLEELKFGEAMLPLTSSIFSSSKASELEEMIERYRAAADR